MSPASVVIWTSFLVKMCIRDRGNIVFGTKYYPYIRIHNADASLSDQQFRGSVTTPYLIQLQNYYRTVTAQTGGETGGESTPPSASLPTPAPDSRDERAVRVYLALRCDTGEAGCLLYTSRCV